MNDFKTDFAGWKHVYSGKVRDLYERIDDEAYLLIVASDRVSAFDHVLEPPIPGKGALLTALSNWWFNKLPYPNHIAGDGPECPAELADRAMVTRRLDMLPVECVVRGAITGSGFVEYQQTGSVCGIKLPEGLTDGDLLEEPIFTPAYKAPLGEHDENITFGQVIDLVGEQTAQQLRKLSLEIFQKASQLAKSRSLILADTKFEFGVDPKTGELTLADEVLTSDSSRYWDAKVYVSAEGTSRMASFDKQIVRDWLKVNWDGSGVPPALPPEIVSRTSERYKQLLERFTDDQL